LNHLNNLGCWVLLTDISKDLKILIASFKEASAATESPFLISRRALLSALEPRSFFASTEHLPKMSLAELRVAST
jgi:hypothetical protein